MKTFKEQLEKNLEEISMGDSLSVFNENGKELGDILLKAIRFTKSGGNFENQARDVTGSTSQIKNINKKLIECSSELKKIIKKAK